MKIPKRKLDIMKCRHVFKISIALFFLSVICPNFIKSYSNLHSQSYSEIQSKLSDFFNSFSDSNEGTTTFRSMLIPFGGRTESLGNAYVGLCDDINYLNYNPAAGCVQKETQAAIFHNSWIADSKLETLAFTTRSKKITHLSFGSYITCFYVPFSEYNNFGDRVATNYYSETTAAFNASYNFLAGYDFKGAALGGTAKTSWRGMPNYTDDNTNGIIKGSGLEQSALAFAFDFGALFQFNFLKYYSSREPNVRIGFSVKNIGVSLTGFGNKLKIDDPLPSYVSCGMSLKFIKPVALTFEVQQPFVLASSSYLLPYFNFGVSVQFTNFIQWLAGFSLQGSNPRFSTGFEFEVAKIRFNFNYTLDLTTSFAPLNRIGLSVKIMFGDKGRSIIQKQIDDYFRMGLELYLQSKWEESIEIWEKCLELDKRFDPAKQAIQTAKYQIDMMQMIKDSLMIDRS